MLAVVPAADHDDGTGLDKILLTGREGVNLVWYHPETGSWKYEQLGAGLAQSPNNPYWGAGSGESAIL
jgi:aldos-2-ulose dehydratase